MERIEKSIDVRVPLHIAYDQWTQFEQFPRFMDGVKEVRQLDDTHLRWRACVGGKDTEWDSEITEQQADRVIAWRSTSGPPNSGRVRFEPIDAQHTRVRVAMEYEPRGVLQKAGDAMGLVCAQLDRTIHGFKHFLESRGDATGGWHGEGHGGEEGRHLAPPRVSTGPATAGPDAGVSGIGPNAPGAEGAAPGTTSGAAPR